MKRAIAFAYVLGLFLLGGVIGALAMHLYYATQLSPMAAHGEPPELGGRPPHGSLETWGRLLRSREQLAFLNLSEQQQQQVREIRQQARSRMNEMREEIRPRMEGELLRLRDELSAVLEPEQLERLQEELRRPRPRPRRGRRPEARPSGHAP